MNAAGRASPRLATLLVVLLAAGEAMGDPLPKQAVSLAGTWNVKLDPEKRGVQERWFDATFHDKIHLPGSLDDAGYGPENAEQSTKFLSRVRKFEGQAWYQREIQAPAAWADKRLTLHLERCLWETEVWIDEKRAGVEDSLMTPHEFDLTGLLPPGPHRLTIRVDSAPKGGPPRGRNHAYSEHTQTIWNGIIGQLAIIPQDKFFVADVQVYPQVGRKMARVVTRIGNLTGGPAHGELLYETRLQNGKTKARHSRSKPVAFEGKEAVIETDLDMGDDVKLWDEFAPNLYDLTVRLEGEAAGTIMKDERSVVFGLRDFGTQCTQFTVNGRVTFLRGTHDAGNAPLRGYPDMDVESWRRIYRIGKSYGLNHWRFHSWTPPEAAFVAADQEGIYLQIESVLFAEIGKHYPPGAAFDDAWRRREFWRVLKTCGNHPSFCMMTLGNEITDDRVGEAWIAEAQKEDPRHLYATASNDWSRQQPHDSDQFWVTPFGRDFIENRGRAFFWNERPRTDRDYRDLFASCRVPVVTHELGQWFVYPNLGEIPKYRGHLRARNFEQFRASLAKAGMLDQAGDFLRASGSLSALLYREEIERTLRTPRYGGFQLLDLHDYSGQGSATVGMLDAFWDSKGFITPEQFRRFCQPITVLARFKKDVWTTAENFTADIEVAHYGRESLRQATPVWKITDATGKTLAGGEMATQDVEQGGLRSLGRMETPLGRFPAPARLCFAVALAGGGLVNEWPLWVYPETVATETPAGVLVAGHWDASVKAALAKGGRVLLLAKGLKRSEPVRFTTVFWSPLWFPDQPMSCGALCDPRHPALACFPTESHLNWQWWELLSPAKPVRSEPGKPLGGADLFPARASVLNGTPAAFRPIVQIIDQSLRNNKEGVLWESRVASGRLVVCTLDLTTDLEKRVVARQLRHSLLHYLAAGKFAPASELEPQVLDRLLQEACTAKPSPP